MAKKLPMKWFPGYTAQIRLRKVDKWAEHFAKHGSPYFDTWEEAHLYMVEKAKKDLDQCKRNFDSAKRHLSKVEALKKPDIIS